MTATQQRAAADHLCQHFAISQRRASRVLGRSRSSLRYRPAARDGEATLLRAIQRLARRHPRHGYRRIHARLLQQGWAVNLKRIRRLWIEPGLRRPLRRIKPRKLGPKPGSSANSCVNRPARFKDDVGTQDFLADRNRSGGTLKWRSRGDESTRECLALHVAGSLSSQARGPAR